MAKKTQEQDWDPLQPKKDAVKPTSKSAVAGIAALVSAVVGGGAGILGGYLLVPYGELVEEASREKVEAGTPPLRYKVSARESLTTRAWIPDITLDEDQKASLVGEDRDAVVGAVEDLGGYPQGPRAVVIELWGNRSKPVSLTDITPHSDCAPPERGATVLMSSEEMGAASGTGVVEYLALSVGGIHEELLKERIDYGTPATDAGGDGGGAAATSPIETKQPYFDETNPVILKDDPFTLRVNVISEQQVCDVTLDATVSVDGVEETFPLMAEGEAIRVGPSMDRFEKVDGPAYIAGNACGEFIETAPENIVGFVLRENCPALLASELEAEVVPSPVPSPTGPAPTASPTETGADDVFAPVQVVPELSGDVFAPVEVPEEGLLGGTEGDG